MYLQGSSNFGESSTNLIFCNSQPLNNLTTEQKLTQALTIAHVSHINTLMSIVTVTKDELIAAAFVVSSLI
jgi:hypothetical protein